MTHAKNTIAELFKLGAVTRYLLKKYLTLFTGGSWSARNLFNVLYQEMICVGASSPRLEREIPKQFRRNPMCLPQVKASALVPAHVFLEIKLYNDPPSLTGPGTSGKGALLSVSEQVILNTLIQTRRPHQIFEFGTARGVTTYNFLINAPAGAHVHTLDIEDHGITDPTLRTAFESESVSILRGDSRSFHFEPYWGRMDFIFIDANHLEPWVTSDSLNALKMLAPGGVIVWHDYGVWFPGVLSALNKLRQHHPVELIRDTSLAVLRT